MKKKSVVGKAVITLTLSAALLLTAVGCGSSNTAPKSTGTASAAATDAKKPYTIRLGTIQPQDNVITQSAEKFAAYAKEKSGGRLDVKVLATSQLGSAKEQLESVKLGSQEMFIDDSVWLGPYVTEYNIMGMSYTFRDFDHVRKFFNGPEGQQLAEKVRTTHKVKVLSQTFERIPRNVMTVKPVKSVADFKGIKMRVPEIPSYVEVWKAVGTAPTPLAFGEIYTAMQQGVIEGMECPTDTLYDSKIHEVAKYFMPTKHIIATCALVINDKFYQGLPDDLKKIMDEATKEAEKFNNEMAAKLDTDRQAKMKEKGVTIVELNTDDIKKSIKDLPAKLEDKGIWPKGLYEKIQAVK